MARVEDDIREERLFMKMPDQGPNLIPHGLAYVLALPWVQNKRVLEIGCGIGYGTKLLAEAAEHIVGVDYSQTAIDYALRWKPNNCEFLCKDADVDLPLKSFGPDVVVAMQALEHLDDPKRLIQIYHDCTWIFALPNGGESIEHHHYKIDESLIRDWFGDVELITFNDWGVIGAKDFTNYFGVR